MSGKLSLFVKLWLSQYDDWKSFAKRENFSKNLVERHTNFSQQRFSMEKTNKSLLWDYFEKLPNGSGKCKTCKKEIACTAGNTTGLGRHLSSHHVNLNKVLRYLCGISSDFFLMFQELEDKKSERDGARQKRKASTTDDNPGASKRSKEDFFKAPPVDTDLSDRFHKELIKHIAHTCTSFNQYGKSFQRVIDVLTKRVKVKHPRTLSRMVDKEADVLMADITAIIKTVKADLVSLGFTTDLWTSRALDSYISLTLSFIDRSSIIIMIKAFLSYH